jgi:hypothetical protein
LRKVLILFFTIFLPTVAQAQVNFTSIPQKLQLYARNGQSDTGMVTISGTVNNAGANYSGMRVKVYRNNSLLKTLDQTLTFNGGTASFSIPYGIKAELAEYKFEALGVNGSSETLLRSADSVVCGDVYIITGQSNAEAHSFAGSASANNSPFIRVFGYTQSSSDVTWRIGQGDSGWDTPGNTGQWGLRMARLIIDNHKIPVAIFNGCQSGQPISFFKRNSNTPDDLNTNYGRLLTRLKKTGLTSSVKALLWFQGEQDANEATTMANYMTAFTTLRSGWLNDYPSIKKIYVFQIGSYCINSGVPVETFPDHVNQIKEAHRRLGEEVPDLQTMSSSGADHYDDGRTYCHYPFTNGYELFGNNAYWLLARDFYGRTADNIDAPTIKFAEVSRVSEITLIMKNIIDSISWNSGSETNFQIEGSTAKVVSGKTYWNRIVLTLSATPTGATGISYMGTHDWHADPIVRNRNGIGAVHFYKFPLTTAKYRDSACVAAILKANSISLPVDSVAVYSGQRITALHLSGKKLSVIPKDIGYMDSLKILDLSDNLLSNLPDEIRLSSLVSINIDNNRICGVWDSLGGWIGWVDRHSTDANWANTQRIDETRPCNGTALRQEISKLAGSSTLMTFRVTRNVLHVELLCATPGCRILIVKQNGVVMARHTLGLKTADIDISSWAHGLYFIKVISSDRVASQRMFVR